jgi:hypothetical protein
MTETEHLPALSSVVLLSLHDYPRRPVAEQARLSAQLDTLLALLLPNIPARARIVLSGNGNAAVAVLNNPAAALTFAERALNANHVGLGLCIGIDHGTVEVVNVESGEALAGDGLATASLMAASATDAGLLVTQNFRTALAQMSPGAEYALVPTSNLSDAGLRTYQVFSLDRLAPRKRRHRFLIIAISVFLLLMGTSIAVRLGLPDRPRPLGPYLGTFMSPTPERITIIKSTHGKR